MTNFPNNLLQTPSDKDIKPDALVGMNRSMLIGQLIMRKFFITE